jgi:hypothetical protein
MSEGTQLDLGAELDKVKNVLGALWAKVNHGTEDEASSVAAAIDAIGTQPVPEPEAAAEEVAAPSKPLSEMTTEELQAELAARGNAPTGSGS